MRQKRVKTGRKKPAVAPTLSCKNLYFPAPTMPAESTACRFFTRRRQISAWQIKAREHALDFRLAWSLKGER
jgi:hypothetical protein